jgi:hypothetical protein
MPRHPEVGRASAEAARKKESKAGLRRRNRAACVKRADGQCEWCGHSGGHLVWDHFWGRARDESVPGEWMLCLLCNHEKTENWPSHAEWLTRFRVHAGKHGYTAQIAKVDRALTLEAAQHPTKGVA